jgi:hypothetical protein
MSISTEGCAVRWNTQCRGGLDELDAARAHQEQARRLAEETGIRSCKFAPGLHWRRPPVGGRANAYPCPFSATADRARLPGETRPRSWGLELVSAANPLGGVRKRGDSRGCAWCTSSLNPARSISPRKMGSTSFSGSGTLTHDAQRSGGYPKIERFEGVSPCLERPTLRHPHL